MERHERRFSPAFLAGGGEMGERIRAFDWTRTSIGLPETWPQGLRTAMRVLLTTRHPIYIFWGPEHYCFYNDAYRLSMGPEKHPAMLGARGREVWKEIWDIIGPQIEAVMGGGEATWHEDQLVPIIRHGRLEDAYWTYSYGPIDDDSAPSGVGGVMVICTETTGKILAEQELHRNALRKAFVLGLSDQLRPLDDPQTIMATAAAALGAHLGASCVGYSEADSSGERVTIERDWTAPGAHSVAGVHRLNDYGPAMIAKLHAGETVFVRDVAIDALTSDVADVYAGIRTRAFVNAPIVKSKRLAAILYVLSERSRNWAEDEVALIREVAARTWAAVEHARVEARLRDTERRKDEFLAMLAHELRNPLAPIRNAAEVLWLLSEDPVRVRDAGEIIVRQARHMGEIVDDLLDVSRVTRGLISLDRETVDLRSVVMAAVEQARPLIDARSHQLQLDLPESAAWVSGDRMRLTQIFTNLLNNAAKYTAASGVIDVRFGDAPDIVEVEVIDTGEGIETDLLPHIFDLFAQGRRTPDRTQGGLGIGLSIVKTLVQLHDGAIKASSAGKNRGSRFTVCLPRAPAPADEQRAEDAAAIRPSERDGRLMRVLVVDDNVDAADALATVLELDGHSVVKAHDAKDAIACARNENLDAMLLDIGLPGIDGYELARRIRALPEMDSAVLIAVSGYGQMEDRRRATEAGFDHYLVKPVDFELLRTIIGPAA